MVFCKTQPLYPYICAQVKTQKWNANLLEGLRVKSFKAVSVETRQQRYCCLFDTELMLITFCFTVNVKYVTCSLDMMFVFGGGARDTLPRCVFAR